MTARVIRADFSPAATPSDPREILRHAQVAAAVLAGHAGRTVDVDPGDGRVATARVRGTYRLSASVGNYSTLGRRPLGVDLREWQAARDAAPRETVAEVFADVEWLRDQSLATEGGFGCEYACAEFSVAPGGEWVKRLAAWVGRHCFKVPVERISAEELASWRERRVVAGKGGPEIMSLTDAVKIYGPLYGREISPEVLVLNHAVAKRDAAAIASAVLRILPKRHLTKEEG